MSESEEQQPRVADVPGAREPLSETLAGRLFEQRVVLLHGPLDDLSATRVSAELMTLDAEGDGPVTLRVDSGQGSLGIALTLMDVVELMGVPVHAFCLGQVGEGVIGVVSVCARRSALPSTRFVLREPAAGAPGMLHVRNVAQWAEMRADERERFCGRVAAAARKPLEPVREDILRGRFLTAGDAVAYGLIDEVYGADADVAPVPSAGRTMGFRPVD